MKLKECLVCHTVRNTKYLCKCFVSILFYIMNLHFFWPLHNIVHSQIFVADTVFYSLKFLTFILGMCVCVCVLQRVLGSEVMCVFSCEFQKLSSGHQGPALLSQLTFLTLKKSPAQCLLPLTLLLCLSLFQKSFYFSIFLVKKLLTRVYLGQLHRAVGKDACCQA